MDQAFDLVTIGAGSGGVRASRFAAQRGAKVATIESTYFGGTCVNAGCIPKKLLSYAAHYAEEMQDARGFGWRHDQHHFSWPALIEAKDAEIARLSGLYRKVMEDAGVTVFEGHARILDPHTVEIGGQHLSAKNILVATGSKPVRPPIPGEELAITSDDAFHLATLPQRVLVYGGGYIAVEFASIFNTLGSQTTIVCRSDLLLKSFDHDVSTHLCETMQKKGMQLRLSTRIKSLVRHAAGIVVSFEDGEELTVDTVLFATGRMPRTHGLGLEQVGVRLGTNGCIEVDQNFRSSVASIYAIGDVIDRIQLTPVATREAMTLADDLFGEKKYQTSYVNVPTAVFSHPNVASVGMSQQGAIASGHTVRIFRSVFTPLRHTLSKNPEKVLLKIVVDAITDVVLGVHMVGPEAGEVIQGFAVALNCGATKADFDRTIGIHPTIAEELVTMRTAEL
jgi:glutathione reductase (NADPH)